MHRNASEIAEEKKCVIIKAEERYVSRIPLVKMAFKQSIDLLVSFHFFYY